MAGLFKEEWTEVLMEDFVPDGSLMKEPVDMTPLVDNNKINLAQAGIIPNVVKNRTTYPITATKRTDTPIALELHHYSTDSTRLQDVDIAELAYDKMPSVVRGHKEALRQRILTESVYNYAPTDDGEFTPIISATGADSGDGVKILRFQDILTLEGRFDEAEVPAEGRILVLSALHKTQLRMQELDLYKRIFSGNQGELPTYGGFKIYTLSSKRMPRYNRNDGSKVAYDGAASNTDTICSVAFHKDEVMQATGKRPKMFASINEPEYQGSVLNFLVRHTSLPIRNRGLGAIYSASA